MIDPTPDNPVYFWENTKLEVAELTDETLHTYRVLRAQIGMRPVPPPPGQDPAVVLGTPAMYLGLEAARALIELLSQAIAKAESFQDAPMTRQ